MDTTTADPTTDAPPDTSSLAEHEAQFNRRRGQPAPEPKVTPAAVDETTTAPPDVEAAPVPAKPEPKRPSSQRAVSHRATPEDVEQINTLTKQLREKEAELVKVKPANGTAPSARVLALQRQIRGLEAELADAQPKPPSVPAPEVPKWPTPQAAVAVGAFNEPKPKLEDFANEEDPYEAKVLAVARWERRKEAFEAQSQTSEQSQRQAFEQATQQMDLAYQARVTAFAQTHPDFQQRINTLVQQGDGTFPPLAIVALKLLDNGPELVYKLTDSPALFADLHLLTDGKPVTQPMIAATQRWLTSRLVGVQTGAPPSVVPPLSPPKPPTPVRTGPQATGDTPPDDGASLAAHEQYYHAKARRR